MRLISFYIVKFIIAYYNLLKLIKFRVTIPLYSGTLISTKVDTFFTSLIIFLEICGGVYWEICNY